MNIKAWEILNDEEKAALSLSVNHQKSSWQAGEILNKAHYKYLEIQARAKTFIKIFTEYYRGTDEKLLPPNCDISDDFKQFIGCTILKRMGYRETLKQIGKRSPLAHKRSEVRVNTITSYMELLENHKDESHRNLHDLIKEFDRWNNFRILPPNLQEPSAFKRRNKTRMLKHLKNLKDLHPLHVDRLTNKFSASAKYKGKVLWLPIISDIFDEGYSVIKIKASKNIIEYISNHLQMYAFNKKDQADEYAYMVENYLSQKDKSCRMGQRFWPNYRTTIKGSYNFDMVNNIIPRRTNLEEAFRDIDHIKVKKSK